MLPNAAKAYINTVIAAAVAVVGYAVFHWDPQGPIRFSVFLALFAGAALLKGRIPGVTGTYSPVFFFVLLGASVLSFSEVVFAAGLSGLVQCTFFVQRRPSWPQIAFNASNLIISSALAFGFIHREVPGLNEQPILMLLILGATVYYVVNTGLVSIVLTLAEARPLNDVWRTWCLGSLPYYVFGALLAGVTLNGQNSQSLWVVGMVCPAMLLVTVYYRYWLKSLSRLNPLVA